MSAPEDSAYIGPDAADRRDRACYTRNVDQRERDREYMRRLGAYVDEANRAALEEHLALPIDERLARSIRFAWRYRGYLAPKQGADDPAQFYARARALGIIKVAI